VRIYKGFGGGWQIDTAAVAAEKKNESK
jgi:hypothetical protein